MTVSVTKCGGRGDQKRNSHRKEEEHRKTCDEQKRE